MMKKCLEENDESLIRIKKPKVSEGQIAIHWSMILARIKPVRERKRDSTLLKKDDH